MIRPFNPRFLLEVLPSLLRFLPVTLFIMLATILAGSLIGLLLAWAKLGGIKPLRACAAGYTWILRCTPSIVLLFIVYYGLPRLVLTVFSIDINVWHRAVFVIITFTLFFAASMSEIFRSAYLAIDRGQHEAALSAGLSSFQAFRRIVMPQAALVALPNFANAVISLMKEGALAYMVGLLDIMGQGMLIVSRNYGAYALETWLALALIYWFCTIVLENFFLLLERRLGKGRKDIAAA